MIFREIFFTMRLNRRKNNFGIPTIIFFNSVFNLGRYCNYFIGSLGGYFIPNLQIINKWFGNKSKKLVFKIEIIVAPEVAGWS